MTIRHTCLAVICWMLACCKTFSAFELTCLLATCDFFVMGTRDSCLHVCMHARIVGAHSWRAQMCSLIEWPAPVTTVTNVLPGCVNMFGHSFLRPRFCPRESLTGFSSLDLKEIEKEVLGTGVVGKQQICPNLWEIESNLRIRASWGQELTDQYLVI